MTTPADPMSERKSYPNPKGNEIDSNVLSKELSTSLGRPVTVNYVSAGQIDGDGKPIPSVLFVQDAVTGDDLDVDPAKVDAAVRAHVKPAPQPSVTDRRKAIRGRADAATTVAQLKAATLEFMDTF